MKRASSGSSQYTCSLVLPPIGIAARSFFEIDTLRDSSFSARSQSGRPSRIMVFGERPSRTCTVSKPRILLEVSATAYDPSHLPPTCWNHEFATTAWREGKTPVVSVA